MLAPYAVLLLCPFFCVGPKSRDKRTAAVLGYKCLWLLGLAITYNGNSLKNYANNFDSISNGFKFNNSSTVLIHRLFQ